MVWRLNVNRAVVMAALITLIKPSLLAEVESGPPVGRITGVVLDEANKPLPGAEVYTPKNRKDATTTDQNGKFVLDLKNSRSPVVSYTDVVAVGPGGKHLGVLSVQDVFEATVDITIGTRAPRELRVNVVDGAGAPVADAEVGATYEGIHAAFTGGKTDASGRFTLLLPALRRLSCVVAVKRGAGLDYIKGDEVFPVNTNIDVGNPVELKLKLNGAQQVAVEAKDSQGRFVSDVDFHPTFLGKKGKPRGNTNRSQINLNGMEFAVPSLMCRTSQEGQAVVDWMPNDAEFQVPFLCSSDEWCNPQSTVFNPANPKVMPSAALLGTVKLSGRVLQPDGKPVAGIIVQAEGRGGPTFCRKYARTGKDGTFEVMVFPEMEYIVGVLDKNWASDNLTGLFVGEGDTLSDVTLQLRQGTLVHGRVIGGTGKRNDQGVMVVHTVGKANLVRWASVDTKGEYAIRLGRGNYRINSYASTPEDLTVADEPKIEKNFDLTDQ